MHLATAVLLVFFPSWIHLSDAWVVGLLANKQKNGAQKNEIPAVVKNFEVQKTSRREDSPSSAPSTSPTTILRMGLFDSISSFLDSRKGDFVKLEQTKDAFGPGPLIILYGVPPGIDDDELRDIIEDGALTAHRRGCKLIRIDDGDSNDGEAYLDMSLQDALEKMAAVTPSERNTDGMANVIRKPAIAATSSITRPADATPVLFFSGFRNDEMMQVYDLLGEEIYKESGTVAACAKSVPNAMQKPLRQVLDEISGDHQDAISLDKSIPDEEGE